jgi:hypothetical protein
MTTRPTLSRRSTVVLLCASVLAIPAWIGLVRWLDTGASGWATLAPHYAAGATVLEGSRGLTTVTLEAPGHVASTFSQRRRGPYMEFGLQEDGFWLRSHRSTPQPALFVPWRAVQRCQFFSAWVVLPGSSGGNAFARFIIHDSEFERVCEARSGRVTRP